jgi:hypothetical protein
MAKGWQDFSDLVWELLYLEENEYTLRVYFEDGQVNLCSVSVKDSTSRYYVHVPGKYSALFYADYLELTKERYGDCPYVHSGMDALVTTDPECIEAISEHEVTCSIGWTDPGESVTYQFITDGIHQFVNLSFRISSNSADRHMKIDFYSAYPSTFVIDGPGKGFDTYETVVLRNLYIGALRYHDIFVTFMDGKMNLCSFGVEYA